MANRYDVIVIGARCAGAPTAMLLARKGYRVLLVDRATFPSDTISTHAIHPKGIAALARWGLLERLRATGCPPIHTYRFDFGQFTIAGAPGTRESPFAFCPRRTVLDKLLVDAAAEAGAEVREGFLVDELIAEDGRIAGVKGGTSTGITAIERSTVVVGADGRYSMVASAVNAERYNEEPALLASYYTYWSGLPMNGRLETYMRPHRVFAAMPTHDGLTVTVGAWPHSEFEDNKQHVETTFLKLFEPVPGFAERIRRARREAPFWGVPVPNYFRKPYGPGWVLVGDAGYNKDPVTAQGITDAFRDAELCTAALDQSLGGSRPFDEAMSEYQCTRDDRARSMYEFTCRMATLEPLTLTMQRLLRAVHGNQDAMTRFAQMSAGTISPAEFFSPSSVASIVAAEAVRLASFRMWRQRDGPRDNAEC